MTGITRTRKTKSPVTRATSPPVAQILPHKPEEKAQRYPERIRILRPYGFIEETHNKGVFQWAAGEIVHNPVTIKMLITRGASWEDVSDGPEPK